MQESDIGIVIMSTLKKIATIAGIIAAIPPLIYEIYLFSEAGAGVIFYLSTGSLPPPPKLPPRFLKKYPVYGHLAKHREKQVLGMREEFETTVHSGKHPIAWSLSPSEQEKFKIQ